MNSSHKQIIKLLQSKNKLGVEDINKEFVEACAKGNINLVEFFLTSPEIDYHPHISINNDHALVWACRNNHNDTVKYLLSSPKIKDHANIHARDDFPFKQAFNYKSEDLLNFYIFELNIKKTQFISDFLVERKDSHQEWYKKAESMFQARDLNSELEKNISSDKMNQKNNKI